MNEIWKSPQWHRTTKTTQQNSEQNSSSNGTSKGKPRRAVATKDVYFLLEMSEAERGKVRKWGGSICGGAAGKAIIQIDDVIVPVCKPPIRFKDRQNPEANWPEDATLGILRETEGAGFAIVSRLASLRVSAMNGADMVIESELSDADVVIVRYRCNGDRFHVFDSIPLSRNIPITPTVYQLLMTATFIKNKEEEEAVIEVRSKLGVTDFLLDEYMMKSHWQWRYSLRLS